MRIQIQWKMGPTLVSHVFVNFLYQRYWSQTNEVDDMLLDTFLTCKTKRIGTLSFCQSFYNSLVIPKFHVSLVDALRRGDSVELADPPLRSPKIQTDSDSVSSVEQGEPKYDT